MNFVVDAQLPPGLVRWLADKGHAAEHVQELGLHDAEDIAIWNHAVSVSAVIVTKDEDFAERAARTQGAPTIVWLRIGNSTNQALFKWLEPRWSEIIELIEAGNRLIEVR